MNSVPSTNSALIVVPGTANYFYNQAGRRVAEALRELGWRARVETLAAAAALHTQTREWCFLVNLSEIRYSRRAEKDGMELVARLRAYCPRLIHVLLESAGTRWFEEGGKLGKAAGVDAFFDLGLHDQKAAVATAYRAAYRFVFNGLLASELHAVQAQIAQPTARPIPWAVVGHQTPERINLVARLIRELDPRGFCYLPQLEPVTEDGPHLNEQQFQRVLERTQYQVWCSHHPGFYLEGERFRASLLAGGVPVKVLLREPGLLVSAAASLAVRAYALLQTSRRAAGWQHEVQAARLFDYLLLEEADFPAQLRALDFAALRQRFVDDYCRLPRLAESLAVACRSLGA